MPTLWLMYWLNYLDRNAIALARLNDLEEDLGLSSSQYQTCVSILFVGYLLGQVPSSKCDCFCSLFGADELRLQI
jgi:sugar phosphate permease